MTGSIPPPGRQSRRKPAAFRLDDKTVQLEEEPAADPLTAEAAMSDEAGQAIALQRPAPPAGRRVRFGTWIALGFGGLASLAVGLAVDNLIRDLFARTDWLGWTGVALALLAVFGLLGLLIREAVALARLGKIDGLRERLEKAAEDDDAVAARGALGDLIALYKDRPETARNRRILSGHMREVIDGRDLVGLAERDLLAPLDSEARRIVLNSAKRVSLVTAVSPRALVDLLAVLFENVRIIRRLSALYGGRPGMLGFLGLIRHIGTHLALTGGMAAGDSLASQVLGHGLVARLSTRLGEGVVNGLLTARIGIAAIAVCRPAPFVRTRGPTVSEFMSELMKAAETGDTTSGGI